MMISVEKMRLEMRREDNCISIQKVYEKYVNKLNKAENLLHQNKHLFKNLLMVEATLPSVVSFSKNWGPWSFKLNPDLPCRWQDSRYLESDY